MEERIYEDNYSKSFNGEIDFLAFLEERDANSYWMKQPAKNLEIAAMDDSEYILSADDNVYADTYRNTRLLLKVSGGENYPIRTCAIPSILNRAKISGNALNRVEKPVLAKILNSCMQVASGEALIRHSENKISAVHGGDEFDYSPLSMPKLFKLTVNYLKETFPDVTVNNQKVPGYIFAGGFYDHSITTALWELTHQDRLLKTYREALQNHGITVKSMKPALRLSSSDVGFSGANLFPMLIYEGNQVITLGNPLKLEHKKKANLNIFKDQLKMIFSQYSKAINGLTDLLNIEIRNPANCMLGIMKKINITKKLAFEAADLFKAQYGEDPCTAHNVYYGINQVIFMLQCEGASGSRIAQAEENIARALTIRWSDYDMPGEFKW